MVIPCPYHGVTGCIGEYVKSVGISNISFEVELYLIFLLVLPRFPFRVKFLHGESVQSIALAWELGGEAEQIDIDRVPAGLAKLTNKRKADRGIGKKESITR